MNKKPLHVITWKEDELFVSKFLELDIASQGKTRSEAVKNLQEALELYLEGEDIDALDIPSIKEVSTQTFALN